MTDGRTGGARWLRVALLGVVLIAFALRLQDLALQDIWWDEARNIDVALRPFWRIPTATELDIHPPLYFWLLHLWTSFGQLSLSGDSVIIAYTSRFLSVAAGLLTVPLLFALTRSAYRPLAGFCAAFVAALSPFWLAESQETRMYTVGFVLLTAAAYAFLLAISRLATPDDDARTSDPTIPFAPLVAFVVLCAAALASHYNALFILVAWYGWWTVWAALRPDRWRQLGLMLATGLGTLLIVAPLAPIALPQIAKYTNPNLIPPVLLDYATQNWLGYLGGYAFEGAMSPTTGNLWLAAMLFLFVGGGVLAAIPATVLNRRRAAESSVRPAGAVNARPLSFLLVWLLGGLALYYIAVLDRGAFNVRYSSFVTPALHALGGIGLAAWSRLWRPLTWLGLLVFTLGASLSVHSDLINQDYFREDMAGLTTWLKENAASNDVIFVDQRYPFEFYYERFSDEPAREPAGPEVAPMRYLFVDINTVDERLTEWAADAGRVFWVQWFESDTDPRRAVNFLLDVAGERVDRKSFRGYSVNWWTLDPPNEFTLGRSLREVDYAFPPAVQATEQALPDQAVRAGDRVPVVVRWRRIPGGAVDRPLKARVALYDADGKRRVQNDQRILNDRHLLPAEWSAEDQPLNVYMLETEPDLAPGRYEARLLVYNAETLEPLGLVDAASNPAGIEAVMGQIEVVDE